MPQRGVCRRSGVRRIAVPALSRLGAVLKAGGVVVIHVILEGVRQLATLNRSGMLFTAAALAIAAALGRFRAVLRASGIVVVGVVFKRMPQRLYNLLLDDRLIARSLFPSYCDLPHAMAAFGQAGLRAGGRYSFVDFWLMVVGVCCPKFPFAASADFFANAGCRGSLTIDHVVWFPESISTTIWISTGALMVYIIIYISILIIINNVNKICFPIASFFRARQSSTAQQQHHQQQRQEKPLLHLLPPSLFQTVV